MLRQSTGKKHSYLSTDHWSIGWRGLSCGSFSYGFKW